MDDILEYAKINGQCSEGTLKGTQYRAGSDIAYISNHKGGKLITIKGSDGNDMLSNFKVKKDSSSIGRVHHGFYSGMKGLYKSMLPDLRSLKREKIYITGHSRGGAIALLLAMYLKARGFIVIIVYTFGAPRSICKGTDCRILHIRTVNNGDRVPMLPRRWMGYTHDCKPVKLKGSWWARIWILGYSDHMIEEYIEAIERNS